MRNAGARKKYDWHQQSAFEMQTWEGEFYTNIIHACFRESREAEKRPISCMLYSYLPPKGLRLALLCECLGVFAEGGLREDNRRTAFAWWCQLTAHSSGFRCACRQGNLLSSTSSLANQNMSTSWVSSQMRSKERVSACRTGYIVNLPGLFQVIKDVDIIRKLG